MFLLLLCLLLADRKLLQTQPSSTTRPLAVRGDRRDPLNDFRKYRGGFDVKNKHYWAVRHLFSSSSFLSYDTNISTFLAKSCSHNSFKFLSVIFEMFLGSLCGFYCFYLCYLRGGRNLQWSYDPILICYVCVFLIWSVCCI